MSYIDRINVQGTEYDVLDRRVRLADGQDFDYGELKQGGINNNNGYTTGAHLRRSETYWPVIEGPVNVIMQNGLTGYIRLYDSSRTMIDPGEGMPGSDTTNHVLVIAKNTTMTLTMKEYNPNTAYFRFYFSCGTEDNIGALVRENARIVPLQTVVTPNDLHDVADGVTALDENVSDLKSHIYDIDIFDWQSLSDGAEHPYGFRKGYYKSDTGLWTNSNNYMCTVSMFEVYGESFKIQPPDDYYAVVREYGTFGDYSSLLASYGEQVNGEPVSVSITDGHYYTVNCGRFGGADSGTRILDQAFVNSFVLRENRTKFDTLENEIDDVKNSTQSIINASISMYDTFGVCGASWDSGYIYPTTESTPVEDETLSWGANLARRNGNVYKNFSRHSVTTRTYLTSEYCLSKLLAASPCNLYIITLGGNDSANYGLDYLGSISDITSYTSYVDYPDTFYGNYGKIIEQILGHAPNAKIILCMWYDGRYHDSTRKAFSDAVSVIANHYGIPRIQWADDAWYGSAFMRTGLIGNHPTATQLSGISRCFERLYSQCAATYYQYFSNYVG